MLALILAFSALFAAVYLTIIRPRLQEYSAQIGKSVAFGSVGEKLTAEAYEFCAQGEQGEDDYENESQPPRRVLVMYATEYGFAREVARKIAAHFTGHQVPAGPEWNPAEDRSGVTVEPRVVNVANFEAVDFNKESLLLFICSTTGDGVPPNEAQAFHDALKDGLTLPSTLKYSVLALGDRGYPHFCRGGVILESLIRTATSADPVIARVEVDNEEWKDIESWKDQVEQVVLQLQSDPQPDYLKTSLPEHGEKMSAMKARYSRANPYLAKLVARQPLCKTPNRPLQDPKNVIRVEFDLGTKDELTYTVGDAVGILPVNNPESVVSILKLLAANGDEMVTLDGPDKKSVSLEDALLEQLDLRVIRPELILELAKDATTKAENALAERLVEKSGSGASLTNEGMEYVRIRHVADVLSDFRTAQPTPQSFVRFLRPLQTRYYSISTSSITSPKRIAATLDIVRYIARGQPREGVCSTYLSDRVRLEDEVRIFVSRNTDFRLPVDSSRAVVMIGAGTGIAPFIGFIDERAERNAKGANVLFFGCRHEDHDFLYKDRLKTWQGLGKLVLHSAFSRDQEDKVYVTDRIRECAQEVWDLLENQTAHLYVCGDGNVMARDVHNALLEVVMQCGDANDAQEAEAFMDRLQKEHRYQRDVWVS